MSVEAIDSGVPGEVIELFGAEALMLRRKHLQQKLGLISVQLNEVTKDYNSCISEIIELNGMLRTEGVDTSALIRDLQGEPPVQSAVSGYGRYE